MGKQGMNLATMAVLGLCAVNVRAQGNSTSYPPGWNGEAMTPPMGWRSWYAFYTNINNATIVNSIDSLVAKVWDVDGMQGKVSLADVGYARAGIDEGWENCSGRDPNHGLRQHDDAGFPMINTDKFPDFKWLVDYGHAHNLSMGWYLDGCACGERKERQLNYEGDVQRLMEFGFDAVKFDGCGAATNLTRYAELMEKTGRKYTIENCHWGSCGRDKWYHNPDGSSCPTEKWAPFNFFRTSGDSNNKPFTWLNNLQTTLPFLDWANPLSRPGVWAYPDMLQVGRLQEPAAGSYFSWSRAHFGAYCVMSSPLVLSMDLATLSNDQNKPLVKVITNKEAIQINQQWSGHPGMLVENIMAQPIHYDPKGVVVPSNAAADFDIPQSWQSHGASITAGPKDKATSGVANIRTGSPGDITVIKIGSGLIGDGHTVESVSLSFRYVAGFTGGPAVKDPSVRVMLVDASGKEIQTLSTIESLGNYSWSPFTTYSPPVVVRASGLNVPNSALLFVALEVTNNGRNLQIPVDDLASGFDIHVQWSQSPAEDHIAASLPGLGQLWAKKQPNGAMAAFVLNHSPNPLQNYTIVFKQLNLTGEGYHVRDIWMRTDNGTAENQLSVTVPGYDSVFVLLSPVQAVVV